VKGVLEQRLVAFGDAWETATVKGVMERAWEAEIDAWERTTVKGVWERAWEAEMDAWEMERERARSAERDAREVMIR
jgi:hypothetical protein